MDNTNRFDNDNCECDAKYQRNIAHQFTAFLERVVREAVPQPERGLGQKTARVMKTEVEKLDNLSQFPTWDICLDIAAQFSGCRQETYGFVVANVDKNQGDKIVSEDLDQNKELGAKDLLTRSIDSSILTLCNPKVNNLYAVYKIFTLCTG